MLVINCSGAICISGLYVKPFHKSHGGRGGKNGRVSRWGDMLQKDIFLSLYGITFMNSLRLCFPAQELPKTGLINISAWYRR